MGDLNGLLFEPYIDSPTGSICIGGAFLCPDDD